MDNKTDFKLHRPTAINRYLECAKSTRVPLTLHFLDGEVLPQCIILELDSINLLVQAITADKCHDVVVIRSSLKKIESTAEYEYRQKTTH